MYPANLEMTASNSVREQLEEIQRELNIESSKKQEPIAFFQVQRFLFYSNSQPYPFKAIKRYNFQGQKLI
jgi:hypothetical protein